MTLQRQILFWLGALAVLIFMLWLLSPVLLPFLAGLVLAYFLDPVADALERLGLPRVAASLLILVMSVVALGLVILLIAPVLGNQFGKLIASLPELTTRLIDFVEHVIPDWLRARLAAAGGANGVPGPLGDVTGKLAGWAGGVLTSILTGGLALANLLSLLIVTPIVAFYLLIDWDHIVAKVDSWVPRRQLQTVRALAAEIDATLAGFIRGQGTVCLLLGAFYAVSLEAAGLNYGLLIGIGAGLLTFIPFAGAGIGGILAIGMALIQFWPEGWHIALILAIFAVGQFIEGNILSPKLVGTSVGLHPVWLMFALVAFGYLFGFAGLLVAVPLAAATGVLVRFALRQYLASRLYLGTGDHHDA